MSQGINELEGLPDNSGLNKRIRKPGGGRKKYNEKKQTSMTNS